jgi:arginase
MHKKVLEEASTGNFVLILGGDHCIPIGTIGGLLQARPSTGIVWVDAHADINTPESSSSGNMHGMPLSFLLGLIDNVTAYPGLSWFNPCLKPRDIVYIGLRDLDKAEKETIHRLGIKAYTMYDIDRLGIGKVMEETNAYLADYKHLHLSYDIDALDPFFAPHTGTAVRGGLTFREGNFICEALSESGRLTSMELVEVNPSLHQDMDSKLTIDMALTLIGSTMGQRIL